MKLIYIVTWLTFLAQADKTTSRAKVESVHTENAWEACQAIQNHPRAKVYVVHINCPEGVGVLCGFTGVEAKIMQATPLCPGSAPEQAIKAGK